MNYAEKLTQAGIRPSVQRLAIYGYLDRKRNHPTAERIFLELAGDYPTLSRTTVYNTLKLFHRAGVVQQLTIEDGELRFDADTGKHGHFKCLECGGVSDLFVSFAGLPELPEGYEVHEVHLDYRGLCPQCSHKQ